MAKWHRVAGLVVAALALVGSTAEAGFPVKGGEAPRQAGAAPDATPATEQYENRALPSTYIEEARRQAAAAAFASVAKLPGGKKSNWQLLGPVTGTVVDVATYTGRATVTSGRVTAVAIAPGCHASDCKILVAAAGGGVWAADNALAAQPNWHPSSAGLTSNALGSLAFDPTDPRGNTVYAGTGEPNGSSDSEAGVGLFRSTDGGRTWSVVPGSVPVALGRSIGAVAVDPSDGAHLLVGTAVARHGSSSVNGGRFTPPGAPAIGVYESRDGGATFSLVFARPADAVDPTSPNGSDFFRGGVTKIAFDRNGLAADQPSRAYAALFDDGVYRSSAADEGGDASWKQVFAAAGGGLAEHSLAARTEFSLAPRGGKTRIYVGDVTPTPVYDDSTSPPTFLGYEYPADLYRTDDANVPAAALAAGGTNAGWTKLSDPTPGTPGYGSYNFCGGQCSYDMVVESPPGRPDAVWLGGQMNYDEIFTAHPPSNGRAVLRSVDAGVHFTDMTNDSRSPPLGMHPDQHAIAFAGSNPDIAFCGSDGGVVRTSGDFVDASSQCATRGISGADLADCQAWLSAIPTRIHSLNDGLATLQFQSLSLDAQDPLHDVMGGTQDNGTWAYDGHGDGSWFETIGGDGGQSGIDAGNPRVRMHTYYGPSPDVNFRGTDPLGWDWVADPLYASGEAASFYIPLVNDPSVSGTWFAGLQHVWRTQDDGGPQDYLDQNCNEYTGAFAPGTTCGDWVKLGGPTLTGSGYGSTKGGSYVVAIRRAATDSHTLWAATRLGRVFVSTNADAPAAGVTFQRVDTAAQPRRFVSGIAVDPANPLHAWVSFSGYGAYTPATPGHVFEVTVSGTAATWKDLSANLGDQPITGIARDDATGDLFASTDFGVALLPGGGSTWQPAAGSLPPVAVYGLAIDSPGRVLYAATHGRGAYRLDLSR